METSNLGAIHLERRGLGSVHKGGEEGASPTDL